MPIKPITDVFTRGAVSLSYLRNLSMLQVLTSKQEWGWRLRAAMQEDGLSLLRLGRKLKRHEVRLLFLLLYLSAEDLGILTTVLL